MQMARVVGSIVSTQKEDSLIGKKIMIIQPIDSHETPIHGEEVAIDTVGSGVGEIVLLTRGGSARRLFGDGTNAIDCAIVGIIDSFER